ncbi:hypothetical protein [Streptomyces blastmyceticus]|uniref:Clostridial hydrophobic W n=1 Tax=Streptomyces blastmyceticus TaxID=68180 RepID=A0ABN0WQ21_9ACTN
MLALSVAAVLGTAGMGTAHAQERAGSTGTARTAADAVKAMVGERGAQARPDGRVVCYRAHVAGIGWQSPVCNGQVAGTTGQSRAIEALEVSTSGVGGICVEAHAADIGWQGIRCGGDLQNVTVGTTGESRRMEALWLSPRSGSVSAQAHVQNYGWMGWQSGNSVTVGTTGASLRLEAVQITV